MQTVEWRKVCDCEGAEHKAGLWIGAISGTGEGAVTVRCSLGPICQRCGTKWVRHFKTDKIGHELHTRKA